MNHMLKYFFTKLTPLLALAPLAYADTPCEATTTPQESDPSPFLFETFSSKTDDHHDLHTVKISTKPGAVKGSATMSTVTDPWADVKSERPEQSVKVKIELEHKF